MTEIKTPESIASREFTYQEAQKLDGTKVRIIADRFWVPRGTILTVRKISFDYAHIRDYQSEQDLREKAHYSLKYNYATTYGFFDKDELGKVFVPV